MNFKVVLLLVVFSVIALQDSSAWRRRWGRWRVRVGAVRWRRILNPGPIGILPQGRTWFSGRDVGRNIDENEDGILDESELSRHLNERDIAELIDTLDEDGDHQLSVDEFNEH